MRLEYTYLETPEACYVVGDLVAVYRMAPSEWLYSVWIVPGTLGA